jgi:hypothetical protein
MLFPPGVTSIEGIPNDLMTAIEHSQTVVSWQRNLPNDEMPERWMWPFPELINPWFEKVQEMREQKRGGSSGDEHPDLETNAYAKEGLRQPL